MIRSPQVSWGGLLTPCIHSLFPILRIARNVPKEIFPAGRSETRIIYRVISVYYMIHCVGFWKQKEIYCNDIKKPNKDKQRQKMSKNMTSLEVSQSSTGPNKIVSLQAQYLSVNYFQSRSLYPAFKGTYPEVLPRSLSARPTKRVIRCG